MVGGNDSRFAVFVSLGTLLLTGALAVGGKFYQLSSSATSVEQLQKTSTSQTTLIAVQDTRLSMLEKRFDALDKNQEIIIELLREHLQREQDKTRRVH